MAILAPVTYRQLIDNWRELKRKLIRKQDGLLLVVPTREESAARAFRYPRRGKFER